MSHSITIEVGKPRAKHVHDILSSKRCERHYDPKKDYKRSKERAKARKELSALSDV